MKDPIKIIHKFKNNNRRIQYKTYIFIGSLLPEDIVKILEIIKNKDFFNSLILLTIKQYKLIENYYGERWYEKFFISYHINSQIKIIEESLSKKKELENKFGKDWYKNHINKEKLFRITYSFENKYYENLLEKKKILINKKAEIDFRTNIQNNQFGGKNLKEDTIENNEDDEIIIDEDEIIIDEEELDDIIEDNFDLEELTKLYAEENNESNKVIQETTKLISQAIHDNKWEKKLDESKLPYDSSLDNISYDSELKNVFIKYFIYDEYIFKDDTIKTMRQKITINVPISDSFGNKTKLLPETQYFWSEYYNINGLDEIMIGQKWIRKNELLKIDIIPNENLKVYEKLRNNLSYLKDSFGYKIKREDDETNI